MILEIRYWGQLLGYPSLESLYIGGGTPSLLKTEQVERILEAVDIYFHWNKEIEFTLEANPETISSREYLIRLLDFGVNRISFGVQSFDNSKLELLGRAHTAEKAFSACETAKAAGFKNINIDMLWGLPGQRHEDWLKDIEYIQQVDVPHISCYGLSLEPKTPLATLVEQGRVNLPEEEEQSRMFLCGSELFSKKGYIHYEISNFARPGCYCQHNLGYWQGCDYLGLGPSAVSTLSYKRCQNPKDWQAYEQKIDRWNLYGEGEDLSAREKDREYIMLKLRTSQGISLGEFQSIMGKYQIRSDSDFLDMLSEEGLIRYDHGSLRLTTRGMLVSNEILARIIF